MFSVARFIKYLQRNPEIKLVPTYRCNLDCSYCYTKPFQHVFSSDMSWSTFEKIIAQHRAQNGAFVRILGGEPTLWPLIDRAIAYLREHKFTTFLLSNGVRPVHEMPTEIHINIEHYYESAWSQQVLQTLTYYRQHKAMVRLRYNLQANDPSDKIDALIKLTHQYRIPSIHVGLAWPFEKTAAFGEKIYHICKKMRDSGIQTTMADPTPRCLFQHEEQRLYLEEWTNLIYTCHCSHVPLINPDGATIFPCQAVYVPQKLQDIGQLADVPQAFAPLMQVLRQQQAPAECRECEFFARQECQSGCLGNRITFLKQYLPSIEPMATTCEPPVPTELSCND